MRAFHAQERRAPSARSPRGSSRSWRLATWGLIAIANPLVWIPLAFVQGFTVFNFTVLLHEVVHHTIFERRRPARRARCSAGSTRCRAASRRASSRAGTSIITPSSARTRTIRSGITCRRRSTRGGSSCCTASPALFPIYFRAARKESATYPAGAAAADRVRAQGVDRRAPRGARADLDARRRRRGAARLRRSGLLRLPDRVHAEPPRPALRHRSRPTRRSGAR